MAGVKKTLWLDSEIVRWVQEAARRDRRSFSNAMEIGAVLYAQAVLGPRDAGDAGAYTEPDGREATPAPEAAAPWAHAARA